jgi:subtilase family serine protease
MLSEKYKTGDSHPLKVLINGTVSNIETVFDSKNAAR